METDEVRLHSRLLSTLLSPTGPHQLGHLFLKSFVELLGLNDYTAEDLLCTTVKKEVCIGNIADDYTSGGRIDLIIEPPGGKKKIVIENKIHAGDQPAQMWRYCKQYQDSHIFYLTLDGRKPSDESCSNPSAYGRVLNEVDFHCISWQTHILKWLEECRLIAIEMPRVRELLTLYIHTVRHLTGKAQTHKMENEIIRVMTQNNQYVESAFLVQATIDQMKKHLVKTLGEQLKEAGNREQMNTSVGDGFGYVEDEDVIFRLPEYHGQIAIYFGFESALKDPYIGVAVPDGVEVAE